MRKIIVGEKFRVGAWVAERTGRTSPWGDFEAFGVEQDGRLIGGFVIDNYVQNTACSLHAAGERGKWVSRELLFAVFDYIFRQLRCKVIFNTVDSSNALSIEGTRHLGFREMAERIKDGAPHGDLVLFVMRKQDCKWLNIRRG